MVPPVDPLERRDFHIDHIGPRAPMDQSVLVGAVDVLSQSLVIGVAHLPSGRCDTVLGKALVVDDAHIL